MKKSFIYILISLFLFGIAELLKYVWTYEFLYVATVFECLIILLSFAILFSKVKFILPVFTKILSALSIAVCLTFLVPNCILMAKNQPTDSAELVIHAGGGFEQGNLRYVNCKEGFQENLAKGNKLIELDFMLSSDNEVFCTHLFEHTNYSLENRPTIAEFENLLLEEKYHGITFTWLIEQLKDNPDVTIVFDTKEDDTLKILNRMSQVSMQQDFDMFNQFIIQVYSIDDYNQINAAFPEIQEFWFTNYKAKYSFKQMFALFDDKTNITTYVLDYPNWWRFNTCAQKTNKKFAVHTVNSSGYINFLASKGVDYIFTDWGHF